MQQTTLQDPAVVDFLSQNFVTVRVDHDAQPDVADRYRAWGWPANIFMNANGQELAMRAGYIAPNDFLNLLKALVADPDAEASGTLPSIEKVGQHELSDSVREELMRRHVAAYDVRQAGLIGAQKFLDRDHVEWAIYRAQMGDAAAAKRAKQSLTAALELIDNEWGGVYQYSTGGRWDRPHYEKLLRVQAAYLRIYALARKQWPDETRYEIALKDIHRYVDSHLRSADGGIYNSQDADLIPGQKAHSFFALKAEERDKLGSPRIDRSRYVLGNAEWVTALSEAYAASGNLVWLEEAKNLGRWLLGQRDRDLFGRGPNGPEGHYLSDNIAAVEALLSLYRITADRHWVDTAVACAESVSRHFQNTSAGYLPVQDSPLDLSPLLQDNIRAARVFNLLHQYSGVESHREAALHAMKFLSHRSVALARIEESGILLANDELSRPAHHLAVVGENSAEANALFQTALATPGGYQRIDWLRPSSPDLLRNDVDYPRFDFAAGYVCSDSRCSLPSMSPEQFKRRITAILFSESAD